MGYEEATMGPVGAKVVKASGSGSTLTWLKTTYAKYAPVPEQMRATKSGVDSSHPYSGPRVAMQERGG